MIEPPILPKGFPSDASNTLKDKFESEGRDVHTPSYMSIEELFSLQNAKFPLELALNLKEYRNFLKNPDERFNFIENEGIDKNKLISQEEAARRINLTAFDDDEILFVKVNNVRLINFASNFFKRINEDIVKFKDKSKLRCVFWFDN